MRDKKHSLTPHKEEVMDSNRTCDFTKFTRGLESAAQKMFAVDFREYAPSIKMHEDNGFPKYQGFLMVTTERKTGLRRARQVGFLKDPATSSRVLMRKCKVLEENPHYVASIQCRHIDPKDPEKCLWGGAVRCSTLFSQTTIHSGTGLPEVVDNLLIALRMNYCNLLRRDDLYYAVSYECDHIKEACDHVGMTKEGYKKLTTLIATLVCI